jgi:hypothetical protein
LIVLYILNAVYPDNGDYPWLRNVKLSAK